MNVFTDLTDEIDVTMSSYEGVVHYLDRLPSASRLDPNDEMPEDWESDPLVLLGACGLFLRLSPEEKALHRPCIERLVEAKGAPWVWANRDRLAAHIEYLREQGKWAV